MLGDSQATWKEQRLQRLSPDVVEKHSCVITNEQDTIETQDAEGSGLWSTGLQSGDLLDQMTLRQDPKEAGGRRQT